MPRRNRNVRRHRKTYRGDARAEIARLEKKRRRLGVSLAALAQRIGCAESTLTRMRRTGLAFPRRIRALTFALRSIEKERRAEEGAFR